MLALLNFSENAIQFGEKNVTPNSELLSNNYHNIMTEEIISNHEPPPHPQKKKKSWLSPPPKRLTSVATIEQTSVISFRSFRDFCRKKSSRFRFCRLLQLSVQFSFPLGPLSYLICWLFFWFWLRRMWCRSHQIRGDLGNGIHLTGPSRSHRLQDGRKTSCLQLVAWWVAKCEVKNHIYQPG